MALANSSSCFLKESLLLGEFPSQGPIGGPVPTFAAMGSLISCCVNVAQTPRKPFSTGLSVPAFWRAAVTSRVSANRPDCTVRRGAQGATPLFPLVGLPSGPETPSPRRCCPTLRHDLFLCFRGVVFPVGQCAYELAGANLRPKVLRRFGPKPYSHMVRS